MLVSMFYVTYSSNALTPQLIVQGTEALHLPCVLFSRDGKAEVYHNPRNLEHFNINIFNQSINPVKILGSSCEEVISKIGYDSNKQKPIIAVKGSTLYLSPEFSTDFDLHLIHLECVQDRDVFVLALKASIIRAINAYFPSNEFVVEPFFDLRWSPTDGFDLYFKIRQIETGNIEVVFLNIIFSDWRLPKKIGEKPMREHDVNLVMSNYYELNTSLDTMPTGRIRNAMSPVDFKTYAGYLMECYILIASTAKDLYAGVKNPEQCYLWARVSNIFLNHLLEIGEWGKFYRYWDMEKKDFSDEFKKYKESQSGKLILREYFVKYCKEKLLKKICELAQCIGDIETFTQALGYLKGGIFDESSVETMLQKLAIPDRNLENALCSRFIQNFQGSLENEFSSTMHDVESVEKFLNQALNRFPDLNQLPQERLEHVKLVIEMYRALVIGDFRRIFDALPDKDKENVDYETEYLPLLKKLKTLYLLLNDEEKEILEVAIILHDIGVPGGRAWTHNVRGWERAKIILERQSRSKEFTERVAKLIYYHGDCQDMGVDGLPRDLLELSENEWVMVLLISTFDGVGRNPKFDVSGRKTKGSVITIDILKSFLELRETLRGHLERNDFYKRRFRHLLSPSVFVDIKEIGLMEIEKAIDSFVPSQELESFKDNWNSRLRIYTFALFLDIADIKNGSYEDFVRLIKLISQISTVLMKENRELDSLIIDTDLDYMSMSREQRDVFLVRLKNILRAMPSDVNIVGVENELKKNHYEKVYGLPIRLESGVKTLVVNLDLLKEEELPDNSRYLIQSVPDFTLGNEIRKVRQSI